MITKSIKVGNLLIGGNAPISVQSMTNTKTEDVFATVNQINELASVGCDLVRLSVNTVKAAEAIKDIVPLVRIPIVADIHFDYKLAIKSIENGISKVRINPSNIGGADAIKAVVDAAKMHHVPIRVGVNAGSLEHDLLDKYGYSAQAIAESAIRNVQMLEKIGFNDIVVSAKCSDVKINVEAYKIIASKLDYPLHIGVTEAGSGDLAYAKSYAGIGALLCDGIGDTIRVSITGNPLDEVHAGITILRALGIKQDYVNVISCPTCARTEIDVLGISEAIKNATKGIRKAYSIAVMGCVVNGIGEGSHADVGVAGGREKSVIFKHGIKLKTISNDDILSELMKVVEEDCHG